MLELVPFVSKAGVTSSPENASAIQDGWVSLVTQVNRSKYREILFICS